jgi:hypothetical protein
MLNEGNNIIVVQGGERPSLNFDYKYVSRQGPSKAALTNAGAPPIRNPDSYNAPLTNAKPFVKVSLK